MSLTRHQLLAAAGAAAASALVPLPAPAAAPADLFSTFLYLHRLVGRPLRGTHLILTGFTWDLRADDRVDIEIDLAVVPSLAPYLDAEDIDPRALDGLPIGRLSITATSARAAGAHGSAA